MVYRVCLRGLKRHLWLPLIKSSQILDIGYGGPWGLCSDCIAATGVQVVLVVVLWPNGRHICSCSFILGQAHIGRTKHQQNINGLKHWWNIDFWKNCEYFVDFVTNWRSTKDKWVINIHFLLNKCWSFVDFVLTKCWWCVFVFMSYWFSFDKM